MTPSPESVDPEGKRLVCHCDGGLVWDPRVDGNVVTCPRCKGLAGVTMALVNRLYELAEVPVDVRQRVNDVADAFVMEVLRSLVPAANAPRENDRGWLAIHERDGSRGEVARLQDERDALRLAGYVIVEHLDHWCECPLPPDANCDPCRLFSRALAALDPSPAASGSEATHG